MKLTLKTPSQSTTVGHPVATLNDVTVRSKKGDVQNVSGASGFVGSTVAINSPTSPRKDGGAIGAPVWRLRYVHVIFCRSRAALSVTVGNGTAARVPALLTLKVRAPL